jgi:hypothetical protein
LYNVPDPHTKYSCFESIPFSVELSGTYPGVHSLGGPLIPRCAFRCGVRFRIQKAVQRFFRALFHHLVKVIPDLPSSILMIF